MTKFWSVFLKKKLFLRFIPSSLPPNGASASALVYVTWFAMHYQQCFLKISNLRTRFSFRGTDRIHSLRVIERMASSFGPRKLPKNFCLNLQTRCHAKCSIRV